MSGATVHMVPVPQESASSRKSQVMGWLLHALSQPLTGLQCALELASAKPMEAEHYRRVLRDGLDLVGRMRILVQGMQDLDRIQRDCPHGSGELPLYSILQQTLADLMPVAETSRISLLLDCDPSLTIAANHAAFSQSIFRLIDSAISLSRSTANIYVRAQPAPQHLILSIQWEEIPAGEHETPSLADISLLLAQGELESTGATCEVRPDGSRTTFIVQVPLSRRANSNDFP